MTRATILTSIVLASLLAACQGPPGLLAGSAPASGASRPAETGKAEITFSIAWPVRSTQVIPLSAQSIRVRVLKADTVLGELTQTRAAQSQTAQGSLMLEADTGLTVRAEAFEVRTPTESDQPIAVAEATDISLTANERQKLNLTLVPTAPPVITGITPTNGGPGVLVTLTGQFGKGPYSAFLGSFTALLDSYDAGTVVAIVPDRSASDAWRVRANGVLSEATGSFKVLQTLDVSPLEATASVGGKVTFSVPAGLDTQGATVSNPTLTAWALVEPNSESTTSVGALDDKGVFTAGEAGTAEVRVFSGTLMATATVRVE